MTVFIAILLRVCPEGGRAFKELKRKTLGVACDVLGILVFHPKNDKADVSREQFVAELVSELDDLVSLAASGSAIDGKTSRLLRMWQPETYRSYQKCKTGYIEPKQEARFLKSLVQLLSANFGVESERAIEALVTTVASETAGRARIANDLVTADQRKEAMRGLLTGLVTHRSSVLRTVRRIHARLRELEPTHRAKLPTPLPGVEVLTLEHFAHKENYGDRAWEYLRGARPQPDTAVHAAWPGSNEIGRERRVIDALKQRYPIVLLHGPLGEGTSTIMWRTAYALLKKDNPSTVIHVRGAQGLKDVASFATFAVWERDVVILMDGLLGLADYKDKSALSWMRSADLDPETPGRGIQVVLAGHRRHLGVISSRLAAHDLRYRRIAIPEIAQSQAEAFARTFNAAGALSPRKKTLDDLAVAESAENFRVELRTRLQKRDVYAGLWPAAYAATRGISLRGKVEDFVSTFDHSNELSWVFANWVIAAWLNNTAAERYTSDVEQPKIARDHFIAYLSDQRPNAPRGQIESILGQLEVLLRGEALVNAAESSPVLVFRHNQISWRMLEAVFGSNSDDLDEFKTKTRKWDVLIPLLRWLGASTTIKQRPEMFSASFRVAQTSFDYDLHESSESNLFRDLIPRTTGDISVPRTQIGEALIKTYNDAELEPECAEHAISWSQATLSALNILYLNSNTVAGAADVARNWAISLAKSEALLQNPSSVALLATRIKNWSDVEQHSDVPDPDALLTHAIEKFTSPKTRARLRLRRIMVRSSGRMTDLPKFWAALSEWAYEDASLKAYMLERRVLEMGRLRSDALASARKHADRHTKGWNKFKTNITSSVSASNVTTLPKHYASDAVRILCWRELYLRHVAFSTHYTRRIFEDGRAVPLTLHHLLNSLVKSLDSVSTDQGTNIWGNGILVENIRSAFQRSRNVLKYNGYDQTSLANSEAAHLKPFLNLLPHLTPKGLQALGDTTINVDFFRAMEPWITSTIRRTNYADDHAV